MTRQYHIQVKTGEIAPYVLLPGDPGRVEVVASQWDTAVEVADNREYRTFTGTYRGMPISCTSTGIGASSTTIAMEELARVGAHTFLRIGTAGTVQDFIEPGDVVVIDAAARFDGATKVYAPLAIPAIADHRVVRSCIEALESSGVRHHVGLTRTADTFYASHPRPGCSFDGYWHSSWRDEFVDLKRLNVYAAEMEASAVLLLARLWNLRAGALVVVLDNMLKVSGDAGEFDPELQFTHDSRKIELLTRLGCDALFRLYSRDQSPI